METEPATTEPLAERRRLPRLKSESAVQFRNVFKAHELFTGSLSRDISASGVRMVTATFLPKEARLVTLFSLPGNPKPIRTVSRVAWTRKRSASADTYDCGLQFVEIMPEDRDAIAGYVERGNTRQIWLRS